MKATTTRTYFRLAALDARIAQALELKRSKLLLGSDPRCDVVLAARGISPQHCYLWVNTEGVRVFDLASTNGLFLNGERVREAHLFAGDTLTLGDLAFQLESYEGSGPEWVDVESTVALLQLEATPQRIGLPERAGQTLVDEEYCDLQIQQSVQDLVAAPSFTLGQANESEELESSSDALDLLMTQQQARLEAVVYTSGRVLDVQYFSLHKPLVLSPNPREGELWFPAITSNLIVVENSQLRLPEGFSLSPQRSLGAEALFLTCGVHQLSLRLVEHSLEVGPLPFFWRERAFYREASKVAGAVFLPFLLLLLIAIPEMKPKEVKQITIVYKPVKQSESEARVELSAQQVTSQTENTGSKSEQQPREEVQMASSSAASSASQASAEGPAPAKPKAYKFSSSVSVDSIASDVAVADVTGSGRSPAGRQSGVGVSAAALDGSGKGHSMGVGQLGSDSTGRAPASTGAKGLVSKKGFDHSYLEPKTVVLGSMDPELLRKILQEYLPQFRHCYQQELMAADKDIKGVIDLDFQISAEGRVSRADIKAKDARFSQKGTHCMARVLRIIEFPKPKGGGVVDVRQPLNFFAETEKI